jgi:hypothetical protein
MNGEKARVLIGMPTISCEKYIARSLAKLLDEIDRIDTMQFQPALAICLNGAGQDESARAIRDWIDTAAATRPGLQVFFLRTDRPGKNNAINLLLEKARAERFDDLQLVDDDVEFEPGSIRANVEHLRDARCQKSGPALVASRFYAKPQRLRDFASHPAQVPQALVRWFNYKIVSIPFSAEAEPWLACSGQSLAMSVATAPVLPDDASGITDDTFLSCYYALNGHIVKPERSVVYFKVSTYLKEWRAQQLRIYAGVEKAYEHFGKRKPALERIFAWPYSPQPERRTAIQTSSWKRLFKYQFFKLYCKELHRMILSHQRSGAQVQWNRAESTK